MYFTKHSITILLGVLLCASFGMAQDNNPEAQSGKASARDVTVIIQRGRLRFTTPASTQELRLEVFNKTGEMVYDSGLVSGSELSWDLRNAGGGDIPSGLYAYRLTIKESESETPSALRGHLILERGRDQLWVTNRGAIGAEEALSGGELTVSSGPETTVAGARIRGSAMRDASRATNFESFVTPTPGQIAKFDNFGFLINSVIAEDASGRIGVGTQTPGSKLTVAGRIETLEGGIKFPNGSVQTTSAAGALFQVIRNSTLTGNGTEGSPLGVAVPLNLTGSSANPILSINNAFSPGGDGLRARGGNGAGGSFGGAGVEGRGGGNGGLGVFAVGGQPGDQPGGDGILALAGDGGLAGNFQNGHIYVFSGGKGLILRSPNQNVCRLLSIDNNGAAVLAPIACP